MKQIETAEILSLALLSQITSQVISNRIGYIIRRHHQKGIEGVLKRKKLLLFGIYSKQCAPSFIITRKKHDFKGIDSQEILSDDVIGSVESQQF